MDTSSALAFTREELKVILAEFVAAFKSPALIHDLQHLAPNEEKMNIHIESVQKEIFQKHNLNAEKCFKDLARIRQTYASDQEILTLLQQTITCEEAAFNQAINNPHGPHGHEHGHGHGHGHSHGHGHGQQGLSFDQMMTLIQSLSEEGPNPQQLQMIQMSMMQFPLDQRMQLMRELMIRAGQEQRDKMQQQIDMMRQNMSRMPPQQQQAIQQQVIQMQQMLDSASAAAKQQSTTTHTPTPRPTVPTVSSMQKPSSMPSMSKD
jgi:G3E family GTPase